MRKNALKNAGANVDFIDLQEITLPMCDGDSAYAHPEVGQDPDPDRVGRRNSHRRSGLQLSI